MSLFRTATSASVCRAAPTSTWRCWRRLLPGERPDQRPAEVVLVYVQLEPVAFLCGVRVPEPSAHADADVGGDPPLLAEVRVQADARTRVQRAAVAIGEDQTGDPHDSRTVQAERHEVVRDADAGQVHARGGAADGA